MTTPIRYRINKNIKRLFIPITFLILSTSCTNIFSFGFDIYELAHFRRDGSGKFEMIFSLDRIQRLMSLGEYMAQDHIEFVRLLIQDAFLATGESLEKIPGISKVTNIHDQDLVHFRLTFEFKNISALNKAMAQMNINADPPDIVYFKMNERAFVRNHTQAIPKLVEYYQQNDDSLTKSFDLPFFFRNMRYIIRYSFSQEIRKATNPLATIEPDHKSLTIVQHVFDKKEKDLLTSNTIFFKTNTSTRKQVSSQAKNINEIRKP